MSIQLLKENDIPPASLYRQSDIPWDPKLSSDPELSRLSSTIIIRQMRCGQKLTGTPNEINPEPESPQGDPLSQFKVRLLGSTAEPPIGIPTKSTPF
jgi:hypothetical protein